MGLSGVGVRVLQVIEGKGAQQHDDEQHARGPDVHQLAVVPLGTIPAVDQLRRHVHGGPAEEHACSENPSAAFAVLAFWWHLTPNLQMI